MNPSSSSSSSSSSLSTPTAPLLRSLRAAILSSSLAKGPKALSGSIRLHVVFSTPKSAKQLYPLAYVSSGKRSGPNQSSNPEEQRLKEIRRGIVKDGMVDAWEEQIFVTATWNPNPDQSSSQTTKAATSNQPTSPNQDDQSSSRDKGQDSSLEPASRSEGDEGPRMVYALESYLYTLPSEQSALLYVSKLDSTGFGPKPGKEFNKPGNEKLMEYLEIIELERERDLQEKERKKKNEMLAKLSSNANSSPIKRPNSNQSSIVRSSSFTGFKTDSNQSPKPTKPISTAASSLYTSSKSSLTTLITHAFLHHFCSLSHWSPPPNQYLSLNSSPPPLPRISTFNSSSTGTTTYNTMPIKHLSLHILARSQATYLFPGSPENKQKRVLTDTGLIKWWKKCTEGVIRHLRLEADENQRFKIDMFDDVRFQEGKTNPIPALPRNPSTTSAASTSSAASSASPSASLSPAASVHQADSEISTELKRSSKIIVESSSVPGILINSSMDIRPYYLIPGYNRLESHPLVPINTSSDVDWIYGHPYSRDVQDPAPLPLHLPAFLSNKEQEKSSEDPLRDGKEFSIATLIPHFPDDPKSRFLDELARDAHEHAGNFDEKKPKSFEEGPERGEGPDAKRPRLEEDQKSNSEIMRPEVPEVPVAVSIATSASDSTNFAVSSNPISSTSASSSTATTSVPRITSQQKHLSRERLALDQVSPNEFWERMGFRQECCSGNVVGAFVIGFTTRTENPSSTSSSLNPKSNQQFSSSSTSTTSNSPKPRPLSLPNPTLPDLILKHLLRDACDWSNLKSAIDLTKSWERGLKKAVVHRGGLSSSTSSTSTSTNINPSSTSSSASASASNEISEEEKLKNVAKGILWADLDLNGPCKPEDLEKAMEKWKEEDEVEFNEVMKLREDFEKNSNGSGYRSANGGMNVNQNQNASTGVAGQSGNANAQGAKVNTLSVKRKRKN